ARWPWTKLLRRVFAIEVLVCARCGGPRQILGAVTEPHAVRRLLAALGLAAESPPRPVVPAARLARERARPKATGPVCPQPRGAPPAELPMPLPDPLTPR